MRLLPVLRKHRDPLVREWASEALSAWKDTKGLIELLLDPDVTVRKETMVDLAQLPATPSVAGLAWEHLQRTDVLGFEATATLAVFVRHAGREDAVRRLVRIAEDRGQEEGLRVASVKHLAGLSAAVELAKLSRLMQAPPEVSWALHLALLGASAALGLPVRAVGHLNEVDNLDMQAALARVDR